MPRVELIYDHDCPNKDAARMQLRHAFKAAGIAPHWKEWERQDPASPGHVQKYGSPTILVDGRDVSGPESVPAANSCRLYVDEEGQMQGIPTVKMIASSLTR